MKSKSYILITAIALSTLTCFLSGCTMAGVGIGLIFDHNNARPRHVTWTGTDSLETGKSVTVTLRDSTQIVGENLGTKARPKSAYTSLYDSARFARTDLALPTLGDTITVATAKGQKAQWFFTGFGPEALALSDHHRDTTTDYMPLKNLADLHDGHGQQIKLAQIQTLMDSRALPVDRTLNVQSGPRTFNIPLESVQQVDGRGRHTSYWIVGGCIGLAADIAIAAAIASAMQHMDFGMGAGDSWGGGESWEKH